LILFYSRKFSVDPSKEAEEVVTLKGTKISRLEVVFPPGPMWLLGVAFFYGIKQIVPCEEGTYIYGNDEKVTIDDVFDLPEYETNIKIKLRNEDDTYPHSCIVRFWVEQPVREAEHYITPEGEILVRVS